MRCAITNKRKLRKLSALVGFEVIRAITRGNTGHRIDLKKEGDERYLYSLWPDGHLERREYEFGPAVERKNIFEVRE